MRFSLGKRGDGEDSNREDAQGSRNGGNGNGSSSNGPGDLSDIGAAPQPAKSADSSSGDRWEARTEESHDFYDDPAPLDDPDDGPALIGDRRSGEDRFKEGGSGGGSEAHGPGDGGRPAGYDDDRSSDREAEGISDDEGRHARGDDRERHLEPVGDGGGAGASQTLDDDDLPDHMPLGEGPVPHFDEPPTQDAGIAVPGAGSDPRFDSEEPDDTFTEEKIEEQRKSSRVSVIDEQPPRPAPPAGASEEEYKWHTYKVYPSGRPDAVEFIDTYRAFGKNRILRGLNMGLPEGMVSMILGPSGTGKSVCIKHMVGLLYPDQGDVLVHGRSVPNMVDDELFEMRKKFGLLFQDGALFGSMNLYDNVAFPLRQHTEKGEDEIEDIVMGRLNEVGLGHSRDKFPNELSGGMRKRAGFARALVLGPDIVLFDEPDSGLDPVRTSLLGELILEVHRDMMDEAKGNDTPHLPTFCVITHNVMMARRTADYINVLWKGRIVEAGPTEDMLNSSNPFIRQFLAGESMGPLTMD